MLPPQLGQADEGLVPVGPVLFLPAGGGAHLYLPLSIRKRPAIFLERMESKGRSENTWIWKGGCRVEEGEETRTSAAGANSLMARAVDSPTTPSPIMATFWQRTRKKKDRKEVQTIFIMADSLRAVNRKSCPAQPVFFKVPFYQYYCLAASRRGPFHTPAGYPICRFNLFTSGAEEAESCEQGKSRREVMGEGGIQYVQGRIRRDQLLSGDGSVSRPAGRQRRPGPFGRLLGSQGH